MNSKKDYSKKEIESMKVCRIYYAIIGLCMIFIGFFIFPFFIFGILFIILSLSANKIYKDNKNIYNIKVSNKNDAKLSTVTKSPVSSINVLSDLPKPTASSTYILNRDTIDLYLKRFIAIDLETTGLNPIFDRIIEISAITYENGKEVSIFTSLINPKCKIPASATNVNHITNDMVQQYPDEFTIIPQFLDYIGNAISEGTVLVAHNAPFDIKFLINTVNRIQKTATFIFQDTLYLSRKFFKGLDNYKLNTVSNFFNIPILNLHRSEDDSRLCGGIFINILLKLRDEQDQKISKLSPSELEVGIYLKNLILNNNLNNELLAFKSSTYFTLNCLYPVLKFKLNGKKKYLIIPNDLKNIDQLNVEPCTKTEGEDYCRLLFNSVNDLDLVNDFIIEKYNETYNSAISYLNNYDNAYKKIADAIMEMVFI